MACRRNCPIWMCRTIFPGSAKVSLSVIKLFVKTFISSAFSKMRRFCFQPKLLNTLVFIGVLGACLPLFGQAANRSITIVTEPRSVVWIDDIRYGRTGQDGRLEVKTISPGRHTVRLRADGFKEISRPLTAAQRGEIAIPLVKTTDEAELAFQEAERLALTDREAAVEAYRKAVRLRPRFPQAYLALGRVLLELEDHAEAGKAVRQARRLRPRYAEASAVEGRIFKESGEEAKAMAAFKRAITEGKGFQPEAYTGLGLLYKEKAEGSGGSGDFEQEEAYYNESAKYLKTALKQLSGAPDALVLYQLLGLVYERQRNYKEAIAIYEEFLRLFPDSNEASAVRSFIVQLRKQMAAQQ
jgi:hypothetical protein